MVGPNVQDRAVKLSREAVELIDAGHKEVRLSDTELHYYRDEFY
jgi:hypothetical protein